MQCLTGGTCCRTLTLRTPEAVTVQAFDVQGRLVQTLYQGPVEAKTQTTIRFDGNALPSGLYLLHVEGTTFTAVRKVLLVK